MNKSPLLLGLTTAALTLTGGTTMAVGAQPSAGPFTVLLPTSCA